MCVYGACLFLYLCGNVCCVAAIVEDSGIFRTLECKSMLYVCLRDVMEL